MTVFTNFNERNYMIQRPSQEEIEKGLAEFKGDYKRLLRNITNCLEFDYKAICSLRTLLADLKAEELKTVGMREKLHRFVETLENYQDVTVFTEQEWNNLVERIVVKPDSLDFEFKNGEKIKITI